MRCLVTGGSGFIGTALVRKLTDLAHDVESIDLINGVDLRRSLLDTFVANVDVVFHLAAATGLHRSFEEYLSCNVAATYRLLEACKGAQLKKFVLASTSSVYGRFNGDGSENAPTEPISWYGQTKLACEDLCRMYKSEYGLPLTVLRYFSVYGPGQRSDMAAHRFIEAIKRDEPLTVYGDGTQVRGHTYIDDCVDATICGAYVPDGVYNVGGGVSCSVWDVIRTLEQINERSVEVAMKAARPGDQQYAVANSNKLKIASGWNPTTSLLTGLIKQWEWQHGE